MLFMKIKFSFTVLISLLLLSLPGAFAQPVKVPPFQMTLYNGRQFKAQDLPLDKHIILLYFSPECEECHEFTTAMLKRINDLQNTSISMITYMALEKVKPYVSENKLDKYPNIFIGTEGNSLFVAKYFRIMQFPFVALFDKNGNLRKTYTSKEVDIDDLITRIKSF